MNPKSQEFLLLDSLFDELFPILRSISGEGIERSLEILSRHIPLKIEGVPSGSAVFDWTTPEAWNCSEAWLLDPDGIEILNLQDSNLHVVNYSIPFDGAVELSELQTHLHSIPNLPSAIPYVTSYYQREWGLCIADEKRKTLKPGIYRVHIASSLEPGRIPFGSAFLHGSSTKEILLSSYLCHPSLANNELSGPLVLLALYRRISNWTTRRHTFRFVLAPETIGSLCFLSRYGSELADRLTAGLVLTCLGGPDDLSYKSSRRETSIPDLLALNWHEKSQIRFRNFTPVGGSDERQFCSPGFNLPVGQMARTIYGEYPGYHNSLDTKDFMTIEALVKSVDEIEQFLLELDHCGPWVNVSPWGEPQLGARGLYPNTNSEGTRANSSDTRNDSREFLNDVLFLLAYCDGSNDLVTVSRKSGKSITSMLPALQALIEAGLIKHEEDL